MLRAQHKVLNFNIHPYSQKPSQGFFTASFFIWSLSSPQNWWKKYWCFLYVTKLCRYFTINLLRGKLNVIQRYIYFLIIVSSHAGGLFSQVRGRFIIILYTASMSENVYVIFILECIPQKKRFIPLHRTVDFYSAKYKVRGYLFRKVWIEFLVHEFPFCINSFRRYSGCLLA